MVAGRHWYFVLSFIPSLLAVVFCILVYRSGQYQEFQVGARYLSGIPNFHFFVANVLPFIAAGVMYLAVENRNIRINGEPSNDWTR